MFSRSNGTAPYSDSEFAAQAAVDAALDALHEGFRVLEQGADSDDARRFMADLGRSPDQLLDETHIMNAAQIKAREAVRAFGEGETTFLCAVAEPSSGRFISIKIGDGVISHDGSDGNPLDDSSHKTDGGIIDQTTSSVGRVQRLVNPEIGHYEDYLALATDGFDNGKLLDTPTSDVADRLMQFVNGDPGALLATMVASEDDCAVVTLKRA